MPVIEKRYAEALIDTAVGQSAIYAYQQELKLIAEVFEENRDLTSLLLSPAGGAEVKKSIIRSVFKGDIRKELLNLLMLLVDKERIRYLPGILAEYIKLAERAGNVLSVAITSAAPLEQEQLAKIKEEYRKKYNASSVKAEVKIDGSLIGGLIVKVGDSITDGTVKGRLESMRKMLLA